MKFRPCIDIHNGKGKADCRRKPEGSRRSGRGKFYLGERCCILRALLSEGWTDRRACDPAQSQNITVL